MPASSKFTNEEFVIAWMKAYKNDLPSKWVADQLGISRFYVAEVAARLRKSGADLPSIKGNGRKSIRKADAEKLNALIKEIEESNG